jgi:hypothetical protein
MQFSAVHQTLSKTVLKQFQQLWSCAQVQETGFRTFKVSVKYTDYKFGMPNN